MNLEACECFDPGAKVAWTEHANVGMTDNYWDLTRMRCAGCSRPWLRAFLEHEAFSRSGRHYRAPATDTELDGITPEAALRIVEAAELRIAGGSRFGGMERVLRGPGKLLASL